VAASILAAACTGGDGGAGPTESAAPEESTTTSPLLTSERRLRLALVAHIDESEEDPFWSVISLGALETADANDIELELHGDADPDVQARIVETLIADGVDGLIVSLAAPETSKPALARAAAAGIPVITINSGIDYYLETSALTHVGQDELTAGRAVGEHLTVMGLTGDVLCYIHETADVGLEERCNGVEAAYRKGTLQRVRQSKDLSTFAETTALINRELEDRDFAAVVTLSILHGRAAADALIAARANAVVTTFDIVPEVFDRIRNDEMAFTVDQRPYLQGSKPVQLLVNHLRDGSTPDRTRPVETIDATSVDEVAREAEQIAERIGARFFP
jgi:simple sugar transport system substrate-binding protein